MAPNQGWQELRVPSRRECPKLFYNYFAIDNGLTLLVTDLMALWQCKLDKYDILADAGRQHCPIDPSESNQQLKVLLSKLEYSLQDGENALAHESDRRPDVLILRTRIDLPTPLRPLDWTFRLGAQNASEMAEQILRPSLREVSLSQQKIESLNRVIKDKDHVIQKLLDRISNSAIDLSLIFPGITGLVPRKGHITVSEATKHVAGMAQFDHKIWSKQFDEEEKEDENERAGLGKLVGGCEKCFAHTRAEHEGWLSKLPSTAELKSWSRPPSQVPGKREEPTVDPTSRPKSDDEATASDDDFERQVTPPSARKNEKSKSKRQKASNNSSDDDESGPPSKKSKTNKIGALGRLNYSKEETPAKRESSSPKKSSKDDEDSSSTASTASQSPSPSPTPKRRSNIKSKPQSQTKSKSKSPSPPQTRSSTQPAAKHTNQDKSDKSTKKITSTSPSKLKTSSPEPDPKPPTPQPRSPSPPSDPSPSPSPAPTPSRHLGRIGGSRSQTATKSPTPNSQRSQSGTPRKLGRIGLRKKSTESPSKLRLTSTQANDTDGKPNNKPQEDDGNETASSSAPSFPSPNPKISKRTRTHDNDDGSVSPTPKKTKTDKIANGKKVKEEEKEKEAEVEETAEQRANRRREELKRNIAPTSTSSAAAGNAAKKKRRF